MKANYKNWFPKDMLVKLYFVFLILLCISVSLIFFDVNIIAIVIMFVITFLCFLYAVYMNYIYYYLSNNGKHKMQQKIINNVAKYMSIDKGKILDVGCGSGALSIEVAKNNPNALVVGLDRWGKEYSTYSKKLCFDNAKAEGVSNVDFIRGNAVKLDFSDGTFDGLVSNYVYHNIIGEDKKSILYENLRVLKKGGRFAIHDLMSKKRYGDMDKFIEKLKAEGYAEINFVKTSKGLFFKGSKLWALLFRESYILYGEK